MTPDPRQTFLDAVDRWKAGTAGDDELRLLQNILQSGGVNFGQSNQVAVYGSVLGTVNLQFETAAQARAFLSQLQPPYIPPKLPAPDVLPEPGPLPPGSRLPFNRNALFTGRESDLKALALRLLHEDRAAVGMTRAVVATGTGGLGKTQLAVEFCYRYGRFFHGVHWLQAPAGQLGDEDPAYLSAEIAACGLAMALSPWPETLPEQVQRTLQEWQRGGARLVVWDNLEHPRRVQEALPTTGNVRLLVTSRRQEWPRDLLSTLPLETLPRAESLALLRRLAPHLHKAAESELDRLAGRLGDLPLALDLAGRYLDDRKGLRLEDFLQELQGAGSALAHSALKDWTAHNPTDHQTNLAATFSLSWDRLESPAARQLFCSCGYCAPTTPVPWNIFYALKEAEDGPSQAGVDRELRGLADRGLVGLGEEGVVIHPLLAEFARLQDAAAQPPALPGLANTLGILAGRANATGLPEKFKPLRPHVEATAGWAEQARLQSAGGLWNELGYHKKRVAEYGAAKASYERALRVDEAAFGPDNPDVARDINNLGTVLRALGDLAAAKAALERALRIDEATSGPDHPNVARDINNLGGVLQDLGDLTAAKAAYERALPIFEKHLGPEHPNVATLVNNLGGVLRDLGDLTAAKAAFERALDIDEAAFGPDHPRVATDINNLGNVLRSLGDFAGAQAAYERALRIDEAAFGPDHPDVGIDVNNLGGVLRDLDDLAAARAAFERALRIDEAAFGPDHPSVAIRVNNLGGVLRALGDLSGARAAFERALRIDLAAFGPDHPNLAIRVNNLGNVLQDLGDLAAARTAYERALLIYRKFLPGDHPHIRIVEANLAQVIEEMEE